MPAGRRLLSATAENDKLELVRVLHNPRGTEHVSQMVSDRPGRVEKRCGSVMSAMDTPTDPHERSRF